MQLRSILFVALVLPAAALAGGAPPEPISVQADLDGDGTVDSATLTQDHARVGLVVRVGSRAPQTFEFRADPAAQDAVCTLPVTLETAPSNCHPEGPEGGSLPGCVASAGKIDLAIVDGSCDAIHLYWNGDRQRLDWWRR